MVIHGTALVAVHVQPVTVSTFTAPVPPPASKEADRGEMSNWHGVPSCRTWTRWSFSRISPCRDAGAALGAT
jgi:hypothetical protein